MEFQHLQTFLAVADAQSLTRAAESRHLSQPAISAHIKSLEDDLGVTLFQRTGRGMKLTDAGEELLINARDIVTRAAGLTRRAAELSGQVAGVLRLGIVPCGYDFQLARIVGQTRAHCSDLRVEVVTGNSASNIQDVLDQELDVAFAEGDWDEPRLRFWKIGASRLGIIGPAAWRDQLSEGGWPRLTEFPWIFQSPGCSYCKLLHRLGKEHRVTFTPEFRSDAFGAVKDLVAEGLALSLADLDEVQPWIDAGDLFAWDDFEYAMPVSMLALRQREDEPMIQAFMQIAREAHTPTRRQARA